MQTDIQKYGGKPLLRWVGGKSKQASLIENFIPPGVTHPAGNGHYYEPFAGGAALFFHVRPPRATLNDICLELINVYRFVATCPNDIFLEVKRHEAKHSLAYYKQQRAMYGQGLAFYRAARTIYLLNACFNGIHRQNAQGEFNTPMGDKLRVCNQLNLFQAHTALKYVTFSDGEFDDLPTQPQKGDFVFMDPPYDEAFTNYTPTGFHREDQIRISRMFYNLDRAGVSVVLTVGETPLMRQLYEGYIVESSSVTYKVNPTSKRKRRELLITANCQQ